LFEKKLIGSIFKQNIEILYKREEKENILKRNGRFDKKDYFWNERKLYSDFTRKNARIHFSFEF